MQCTGISTRQPRVKNKATTKIKLVCRKLATKTRSDGDGLGCGLDCSCLSRGSRVITNLAHPKCIILTKTISSGRRRGAVSQSTMHCFKHVSTFIASAVNIAFVNKNSSTICIIVFGDGDCI